MVDEVSPEGTAAAAPAAPKELITTPPNGAEFADEEVKTAKGTQSLGTVPLLVWKDADALVDHYGREALLAMADGTSLRVSFQGIARRLKAAGKSDDEIKDAQIRFKPNNRQVAASTPVSRAANAAKKAAEKVGVENADLVSKLLEDIASGKLSMNDIQTLTS